MRGSVRRLLAVSIVVTLAACQPTPVVTPQPSIALPTPTPASTAEPTSSPAATAEPSLPPTTIDLPAGFDAIPWAHMPVAADTSPFVVSIGVLGKPATTTRTFAGQPEVWTSGPAVVIDSGESTEIIDARTGQTMATFDRRALALPRTGVDPENLNYSFIQEFVVDAAHGYLYDMSANRDGMQLRRFALDGSHATLLAILAPDPGRELWDKVDFLLADDGTVVATACPPEDTTSTNHRCRLYLAPAGAAAPIKARFLPLGAPRPCFLLAADATHLIGSQYVACRADGGAEQFIPYMALNLSTLKALVTTAPSDLFAFGMASDADGPGLAANLGGSVMFPSPYPVAGVVLRFTDSRFVVGPYIEVLEDPEGPPDPYERFAWAIRGRGPGWTLLHGYGPDYVTCVAGPRPAFDRSCPSGPEILETTEGRFVLPPGTWGEIVTSRLGASF